MPLRVHPSALLCQVILATAACLAPVVAFSADVPRDLQAALRPFPALSVAIEGQTLRVVMNEPFVQRRTYEAIASAYCTSAARSTRRPWGGLPLKGIEVVNVTQAQGFGFSGTVVDCARWAKLPPDATEAFVDQRTRPLQRQ